MCNSKSFCSCVGLSDHFCQCLTQFIVHSTVHQYCKFWLFRINTPHTTHLNGRLLLLKTLVHADNQLQQGNVDLLALSYRVAPLDVVQVALNVETVDVSAYQNKMESVSATQILVVATPDNTKLNCLFQKGLKFSAISSFVASSR